MSTQKTGIPIKPIDFSIAKRVVAEVAEDRNVPRQVFPGDAAEEGRGGGKPPRAARSPHRKFTVTLPDYVIDAILARALQSRPKRTARAVVLESLKAIGIAVKDEDMVLDGRRSPTAG